MTWEGAAVCSSSSYFLVDWRRYVAVVLPPEELLPYPFAAAAFGAARIATAAEGDMKPPTPRLMTAVCWFPKL